jgi:phage shock protein E
MKAPFFFLLTASAVVAADQSQLRNPIIEYKGCLTVAQAVQPVRETNRVSEEEFAALAAKPGTVVLDARSADKYALRHVRGAINLPFTDFTEQALARVIPAKNTRVLIYCNNNFRGAPVALAGKAAPAALNISTYVALATYGYTNVYELGPLTDVKASKLVFEGTEVTNRK